MGWFLFDSYFVNAQDLRENTRKTRVCQRKMKHACFARLTRDPAITAIKAFYSYQFLWMRCTTLKPSNVYLYIISSNINESIDRTVQSVVRRHVRIEDTRAIAC